MNAPPHNDAPSTQPLSADAVAEMRRLADVAWDTDGETLVWLEGRSDRGVLLAQTGMDAPRELNPELSVRAKVGYGGGEFAVAGGWVTFVEERSGRLFRQPLAGGPAEAITPAFGSAASPVVSPDGLWVAYVHHDEGVDRLAVVDVQGNRWPQVLVGGHDFSMQPTWSPDGKRFAWVAWDHPQMPWDGTRLYVADVGREREGWPRLESIRQVAGGEDVAVLQPLFHPDGRSLLYLSDESGWGRIVREDLVSGERRWLTPEGVEHGAPAWLQGMRLFALTPDGRTLVAVRSREGFEQLVRIDCTGAETGQANAASSTPTEAVAGMEEYTELLQPAISVQGRLAVIGSSVKRPRRLIACDVAGGEPRVVARAAGETAMASDLADCRAVAWTAGDGLVVHGLYYPAMTRGRPAECPPPLVVLVHGGPTSQVRAGWNLDAQFLATRGYGVLCVNYRGSTGYGRGYMLALRGQWGAGDVEDVASGARYLADLGEADRQRMAVMGGSAGGFTVLRTMIVHPELFCAGVCLYGVADPFHLVRATHKFESRYLDSLLGPLPQAAAVYQERSPRLHAERICRPLAIFQGAADRVVPREQSETIVAALERNGTPHEYHLYEGEGHGWRKAQTLRHFYRTLERFLEDHVRFAAR